MWIIKLVTEIDSTFVRISIPGAFQHIFYRSPNFFDNPQRGNNAQAKMPEVLQDGCLNPIPKIGKTMRSAVVF
jgi:hypothetical protein